MIRHQKKKKKKHNVLNELNPFGLKEIESVHNEKGSWDPQTSIGSKQAKKDAYLLRGAIYYGKGRMTQGRAKRLGSYSYRSGLV